MRLMTKTVLFTCVCAAAQGQLARAQPAPSPDPANQPLPPPTPAPTPPPVDQTAPEQTSPTPSTTPAQPLPPIPSDQAPGAAEPVPVPDGTVATEPPPPVIIDPAPIGADPGSDSYAWSDGRLRSGIGVSTILGGGVTGFTDKTMRNTTSDVGGMWDLRVTIGSHVPLALDVSYLGSAMNINGLPAGRDGTLLGTTLEGALRYNVLPHNDVTPYVFAGIGWQRYDVTETNVTLSDSGMNDTDNLVEFPVGAGFAYRRNGFVGDLRGTFRAATDQNLVLRNASLTPTSDDFAPMHTWEASAAIGYEF